MDRSADFSGTLRRYEEDDVGQELLVVTVSVR